MDISELEQEILTAVKTVMYAMKNLGWPRIIWRIETIAIKQGKYVLLQTTVNLFCKHYLWLFVGCRVIILMLF